MPTLPGQKEEPCATSCFYTEEATERHPGRTQTQVIVTLSLHLARRMMRSAFQSNTTPHNYIQTKYLLPFPPSPIFLSHAATTPSISQRHPSFSYPITLPSLSHYPRLQIPQSLHRAMQQPPRSHLVVIRLRMCETPRWRAVHIHLHIYRHPYSLLCVWV